MVVAEDLPLLIPIRTAQITVFFARSSGAGSIQGQADEAAVIESFVALGLTHGSDCRPPRRRRVEACGEVAEGIIAEALGDLQGAAGPERTSASMPAKVARRNSAPINKAHSRAAAGMRPSVRPSPGKRK